ncbi:Xaa-Pro peptidase family protein [Pseudooceanicola sp. CBS1P-1]|uniref:M24 family metallopeptidase n=1 Tax=Pseudooceanicola albus TaxID=2692189 RepID=A0A6L7G739_9RHOB|nr:MULTISPECIES: Xaa-Pro peptidase family protein [Pseudooceanicola]MBT9384371.1 Xaa-Pro peptidase family protein [Pseudooceanicola endophyticus]MXN19891.1 M24 family metallopeptidase [Pseudooceanicola albus]
MSLDTTAPRPRIARLKAAMAEKGIDALVSFKPEHTFYMSGFNPVLYSHPVVMILPAEGEPTLLVHALRDAHGRAEGFVEDTRAYGVWSTTKTMGPTWPEALQKILGEKGLEGATIGLEADSTPMARWQQVQGLVPGATLADSSKLIDRCRLIKDPDEIEMARVAADLADRGMDAAIAALADGGTEREAHTASLLAMNTHWTHALPDSIEVADFGGLEGGMVNGLATWVLSGERMFRNCDNSIARKPLPGETVAIFIWTVANGIHAENERTVAMGPLPDARRRALETILSIREEITPVMKPGTPLAELYNITKAGLIRAGYDANIPGRIGHTIGIGAHEHFSLDGKTDVILEPGMLFTLEPNLRVPDQGVATQISDTILITEDGHEYLTKSRGGYIEV